MKQTKKQPQPKFFVNDQPFVKETDAMNQLQRLKNQLYPNITFIDVKSKIETHYTYNRKNYFVNAKVYTPAPSLKSTANSSNDRDHADSLQNVQQTAK